MSLLEAWKLSGLDELSLGFPPRLTISTSVRVRILPDTSAPGSSTLRWGDNWGGKNQMADTERSLSMSAWPTAVRGEKKVDEGTVSGSGRSKPRIRLLLR